MKPLKENRFSKYAEMLFVRGDQLHTYNTAGQWEIVEVFQEDHVTATYRSETVPASQYSPAGVTTLNEGELATVTMFLIGKTRAQARGELEDKFDVLQLKCKALEDALTKNMGANQRLDKMNEEATVLKATIEANRATFDKDQAHDDKVIKELRSERDFLQGKNAELVVENAVLQAKLKSLNIYGRDLSE